MCIRDSSPLARAPEFPGGLGLDDYDITRQMSALSLSSTATSVISSSSASSIAERVERLQADIESLYEQRDEAMRTQVRRQRDASARAQMPPCPMHRSIVIVMGHGFCALRS